MATVKVKALEKLVDYAASGVGAVAGAMLAPWKARREAEAKRITAQADADALQIIADAQAKARQSLIESGQGTLEISQDGIQQRIEFQERKRQSNIVSVVRDAAAELGDKEVPNHEPDPDWTARFFDSVQDVSSEEMQKIWAKILSGEVENPGRTSLRTLDTLRNMTKRDAEMFRDVCDFVIESFVFYDFHDEKYKQSYDALRYSNLLHLQECGLMNAGPFLVQEYNRNNIIYRREGTVFLPYQNTLLIIVNEKGSEKDIKIPIIYLTTTGRELYRIAECALQMDYLRSFAEFLRSKNCQLSYAKAEKIPGGTMHANFILIEP